MRSRTPCREDWEERWRSSPLPSPSGQALAAATRSLSRSKCPFSPPAAAFRVSGFLVGPPHPPQGVGLMGLSCWSGDRAGPRGRPRQPVMLLSKTPRHRSQQQPDLVFLPVHLASGLRRLAGTGHSAGQAHPLPDCTRGTGRCCHPERRAGAELLQPTPACLSPASQHQGCPRCVGSCFPAPLSCHSQLWGCPLPPMKGNPEKPRGKSTKPYPPPSQAPRVWGEDVRKGPEELLTIQRAFSTDAFGRRGLQVSTWFGFGSPPPFQLIRPSTESVPHGC